ncbi:MAG: phosphatase PAP2 family protein [Erysipelotrichaceae bacterium]|nr:phosphatase PAP2 family protein [Erysipelotrichaceae bacterium]
MDRKQFLNLADKVTKYIVYISYGILLLISGDKLPKVILIPGIGFVLVTLVRSWLNKPRPYEVSGIPPLIDKKTKGKSFPSRHSFSSTIITMAGLYVCKPFGIFLALITCFIAYLRVAGGVHFRKDVIAGIVIGILLGSLFWMI